MAERYPRKPMAVATANPPEAAPPRLFRRAPTWLVAGGAGAVLGLTLLHASAAIFMGWGKGVSPLPAVLASYGMGQASVIVHHVLVGALLGVFVGGLMERAFVERLKRETHAREMEARVNQLQKMESVGRLASGVAHDFNNLLTAINVNLFLAAQDVADDSKARGYLDEAQAVTQRAARMPQQLLAFSRRQVIDPEVVELDDHVRQIHDMVERLIGDDIRLTTNLQARARIEVDPGHLEQVIVNLCVNARDAMPKGGSLGLATGVSNVTADEALANDVAPGPFATIAVSDTGSGMDDATLGRIFEPFFTTKAAGKGTGLGLATSYGIIKQAGGFMAVASQPGQGTTFTIHLPRVEAEASPQVAPQERTARAPRAARVLLVEDDAVIRAGIHALLERLGYHVTVAENGAKALDIMHADDAPEIDLLLADVVMPAIGGKELADRLHRTHPGIAVLFMSAHTDETIATEGVLKEGIQLIQKPFRPEALTQQVRAALEA